VQRHQFEAYLGKVFDFPALVAQLSDHRCFPHHPPQKVFEAVFLGAALHLRSVHQLEHECRDGVLQRRIGPISEDTLRYALQRLDLEAVVALWCAVLERMKRNGLLRLTDARGLVVAAVDGTEICHSSVRCCDACLVRTISRKVGERPQEMTEYYHRIVVVAVVSTPFPIPLGLRFQQPGEGEADCALALVRQLVHHLGRRFLDVLVGDALYCTAPCVAAVEALGLEWVFTVKENQSELLEQVEMLTRGLPVAQRLEADRQWHVWDLPEMYWARADRSVRVVRTERKELIRHFTVQQLQSGQRRTVRAPCWEHSNNVYATALPAWKIPPALIEQLGRCRWRIDTEVFQTLTTTCSLKRPSVHAHHDQALVGLTMIRVLAYLLTLVFFHRQVLSHYRHHRPSYRDLAHRLAAHYADAGYDSS